MSVLDNYSHHVAEYKRIFLNEGQRGVSRSKAGENVTLALTVPEQRNLDRSVSATTVIDGTVIPAQRDQTFSVSRASKRVKLDSFTKTIERGGAKFSELKAIDKRLLPVTLLRMRTNEQKLVKAAGQKPQDKSIQPRLAVDLESGNKRTAIQRIDRKLAELGVKLIRAIRQEKPTVILDSLILRCQYQRKLELEKLSILADKANEKADMPLVGQIKSEKDIGVGYINRNGETVPNSGISVPIEKLAVGEIKPIVPVSIGRKYKVKRRVLSDKLVRHGAVTAAEKHVAIKPRAKPRKSKASAKRGAGSY